ncbi:hypothetical protein GM418_29940 [Maribellus comscasis]|uniref:MmgE/PrpD family protein n=1 Tax=Maribellus comscasis TaxID=2681766 RepID=A0A6I6KBU9_9BACT|nr:MmgE/PrpD family protein [Maribellus comscasis]QGY47734.1 hypothetical protein GM418_29940 [Maribellus comscasis]
MCFNKKFIFRANVSNILLVTIKKNVKQFLGLKSLMSTFVFLFIVNVTFSQENDRLLSRQLAEIAVLTDQNKITDEAIKAAKKALIDDFGVSFAGFYSPGVQEVLDQEKYFGGTSQATVWIDGTMLAAPDAAFVNSVFIHALDLDDIHIPSITHITSVVVPAAFAVGQEQNATGREVLEAIILGIEISGRLGREYHARKTHGAFLPTSIIGGFGATAASCRLLGLSVEQTMDAFGIFYAHASGNRQALIDNTLTKRIQPAIASRAGVVSAYFAQKGISGPHHIFLSKRGLFCIYGGEAEPSPTYKTDIDGKRDHFEIEQLAFKKYACCGAGHPAIEAAIELAERNKISLKDIDNIEIFVGIGGLVGVPWNPSSENLHVAAQFCAPYEVVSAIKNKRFGPAEITNKMIEEDFEVSEISKKVIIRDRPEGRKQKVVITLKDGTVLENDKNIHEKFFTKDYMSYNDIIKKFRGNLSFSELISDDRANLLLKGIEEIQDEININDFVDEHLKIMNI